MGLVGGPVKTEETPKFLAQISGSTAYTHRRTKYREWETKEKNTYVYTYSSRRSPKAGTKREREKKKTFIVNWSPTNRASHMTSCSLAHALFSSVQGGREEVGKRRWKWAISEWETTVKKGKNIYLRNKNKKFPDRITWFKTSQMSFTFFFRVLKLSLLLWM